MRSRADGLTWREHLLLFTLALTVFLVVMAIEPVPGYMDAAYYYATGIQLAKGNGFSEPFLWNYLVHPSSLPHPSHSYWYPLASMVAAAGMWLTGRIEFQAARSFFLVTALVLPSLVATLSWRLFKRKGAAITAGLLTIFCGYYLPFLLTTDNYATGLLIGVLILLNLDKMTLPRAFLLGILTGLMNLSRADGILWLPLTLAAVSLQTAGSRDQPARRRFWRAFAASTIALSGFALIMAPWLARNLTAFGSFTPPGSSFVLWMSHYDQIFSYTPENFTFSSWLDLGWKTILNARLGALWENLGTAAMAQGNIFLTPLILIACWKHRHMPAVRFATAGWILLLISESFLFPFASVRGGFFHAGAGFQPLWFVLAPIGLETLAAALSRKRSGAGSRLLLYGTLILLMVGLSVLLVKMRVVDTGWNEGEYRYLRSEDILVEKGAQPGDIVMVANPPAYNAMTGRKAIVLPAGDLESLLAAAEEYGCDYLILEENRLYVPYEELFLHPERISQFIDLGAFEDVRILAIKPSQE